MTYHELTTLRDRVTSLEAKLAELEKKLEAVSNTVSQHERDVMPIRRIGPMRTKPIPPEEDFREYE